MFGPAKKDFATNQKFDLESLNGLDLTDLPDIPGRWMVEKYKFITKEIMEQCPKDFDIIVVPDIASILMVTGFLQYDEGNTDTSRDYYVGRLRPDHSVFLTLEANAPAVIFRRPYRKKILRQKEN
jgi:hypothetical protein